MSPIEARPIVAPIWSVPTLSVAATGHVYSREYRHEKGVPIRSISRCLAALIAINKHGSLTMMEIARAAGVPYPMACRTVQTLLHEGMIEQEPARK